MHKLFLALFFISMSYSTFAQIGGNALIAKYSFNNGNANDEVGTNHGIVYGATLTRDRFNNLNHAYDFDGSSKIIVPNNSVFDFQNTDDFSIAFWMKVGIANVANGTPINKHLSTGGWEGYMFWTNITDMGYCNGPGTFTFYTASGAYQDACANALVGAGNGKTWKFVVGTYNAALNRSYFYIDGVLQADSGKVTGNLSVTADLCFGGQANINSTGFFTGAIDDIAFYNKVLTPLEIDSLYTEPNPVSLSVLSDLPANISIFPNPTKDKISVKSLDNGNKTYILYDKMGREITKMASFEQQITLDLSFLSKDIYLLVIEDEKGKRIFSKIEKL